MPVVENLTLEAAVSDDFTEQLTNLAGQLAEVGALAEEVFPLDIDSNGAGSTITELESVAAAARTIPDNIETEIQSDVEGTDPQQLIANARQTDIADPQGLSTTPALPPTGGIDTDAGDVFDDGLFAGLEPDIPMPDAPDETPVTADGGDIRDFLTDPDARLPLDVSVGGFTEVGNTAFSDSEQVAELTSFLDSPDPTESGNVTGFADISGFGIPSQDSDQSPLRQLFGSDSPIARLGSQLRSVDFTIADFNQAFVALVPLTVALIGTLPAAITGLAALGVAAVGAAGALAALGGLAIFGAGLGPDGEFSTENLQAEVDEIQEAFSEAFTPLARDLSPLVDESVNGIERLFNALAARGDVLRAFTDEARAFGSFLIDRIPVVASQLLGFADALAPILGGIGEAFASRRFFRGLAELAASAIPPLTALGNSLQDIAPGLIRLSTGFLIAFSAVAGFLSGLFRILDAFGPLTTLLGFVIGGFLIYASVLKLATVLNGLLGASVLETAKKYLIQANTAIFAAQGTSTLARAVAVLRGALTALAITLVTIFPFLGALGALGGSIGGQFAGVDSNIRSATDALRQFGRQSRRVDGASFSGPSTDTPAGVSGGGSVQQTTVNVQTDGSTDDAFEASNTASFNT